ncbi:hypothetical protein SODALDRAFT_43529 [Sodiomyces alkalinus F11]|uniref:SprT-like domain-containing protein n=1 Tax=Sodiomyces alkalinus (strain CBS 110278 / VKM F-3762 / F11) TaxID=1314773 RepID=A0A3N2QA29_SODAK|nr:hypothetical protein SODALDRAFT_43529 [Sodiomyces alkalinus F11]ROT43624.1 hypothetical protein SODALDRAFT_43529 [Sodiomyces alkalinus F11]
MAFQFIGGEPCPLPLAAGDGRGPCPYLMGGKRRVSLSDGSDQPEDYLPSFKRFRTTDIYSEADIPPSHSPPEQPASVQYPPFLIIRERRSPSPAGAPSADMSASSMERTASGLSISSDTAIYATSSHDDAHLLEDAEAAWHVEQRLAVARRRGKDSQHERILRSLIRPRSREAEFSIDNAALESIFSAANEIFFHNRLSRRVAWDWSHASSTQYQHHIIGTTALRRSRLLGGFETLIVLSDPILNDKMYNRRLLISTFLHELIHSYLFICCGFKARHNGGHTPGFRRIAELIDEWAGPDTLHLRDMEADLDHFKEKPEDGGGDAAEAIIDWHSNSATRPVILPDDYDYHLTPYHRHDHLCPADRHSHSRHHNHHYHHHLHHHHHHNHRPRLQDFPNSGGSTRGRWDGWVSDRREHIPLSRCSRSASPVLAEDQERSQGTAFLGEKRAPAPLLSPPVENDYPPGPSPARQQWYAEDHFSPHHRETYHDWDHRTGAIPLSPGSSQNIYGSPYVD